MEVLVPVDRREQVKMLVAQEVEGKVSVVLPDLADTIADRVRENEELAHGLMVEALRPIVYDIAKRLMASTRAKIALEPGAVKGSKPGIIELGDELLQREEFEVRAKVLGNRFERWMEHAGGRYVNFMEMRKYDLEEAARQREARAGSELAVARFERFLAGKLKKQETVSERFTPEQLDAVWAEVNNARERST